MAWKSLGVPSRELRLAVNLNCGQSFSWKSVGESQWANFLDGHVITLKEGDDDVLFQCENETAGKKILQDYFQTQISLEKMYEDWSIRDEKFKRLSSQLPKIRVFRQDPTETLFAFICSSNNHISRIGGMVGKLKEHYGQKKGEVNGIPIFSFPEVSKLAPARVEEELRQLGFGYRAKYIQKTAQQILDNSSLKNEKPEVYLKSLRNLTYEEAHATLITFHGIGPKVSDCICLFALDHYGAMPVDTHVWQIANSYMPTQLTGKSLTKAIYAKIGDFFRELHGPYAGWAHSVLFSLNLKKFEEFVTEKPSDGPVKKGPSSKKGKSETKATTTKKETTTAKSKSKTIGAKTTTSVKTLKIMSGGRETAFSGEAISSSISTVAPPTPPSSAKKLNSRNHKRNVSNSCSSSLSLSTSSTDVRKRIKLESTTSILSSSELYIFPRSSDRIRIKREEI